MNLKRWKENILIFVLKGSIWSLIELKALKQLGSSQDLLYCETSVLLGLPGVFIKSCKFELKDSAEKILKLFISLNMWNSWRNG